jgi:hypothetical protein
MLHGGHDDHPHPDIHVAYSPAHVDQIHRKRQTNTGLTARRISRLDPSRPSFGREFSDAIAGKIGQPREHRAEVVAE